MANERKQVDLTEKSSWRGSRWKVWRTFKGPKHRRINVARSKVVPARWPDLFAYVSLLESVGKRFDGKEKSRCSILRISCPPLLRSNPLFLSHGSQRPWLGRCMLKAFYVALNPHQRGSEPTRSRVSRQCEVAHGSYGVEKERICRWILAREHGVRGASFSGIIEFRLEDLISREMFDQIS